MSERTVPLTTSKLAIGSLIIGIFVLLLKTLAWHITGSVALLSDALESTVNIASALAVLITVRIAAVPADANHPYGHHKVEYFSAVVEGVMIVVAALLILNSAWSAFWVSREIDAPFEGIVLSGIATILNAIWCYILIRKGRVLKSPALVADGKHLYADVLTSAGVIAGILLSWATGLWILDPLLAALVALNILWSGWAVIRTSLSGLMDEAVPPNLLTEIRDIISENASGAVEAHDLRTRHAGAATFIDFHLVVDGETTVADAHAICDRIEAALNERIKNANITIHVEPEHKAKHNGIVVLDRA